MSEFSAKIIAQLDTSKVPSQINSIQKQLNKIGDIKINLRTTGNAAKSINEIIDAYKDLMGLQQRINTTRVQLSGLDAKKDSQQISVLSGQLNRLMTDYNNLYDIFGKKLSTNQIDNLSRGFDIASGKISVANARITDSISQIAAKISASGIDASIAKVTAQYEKLGTTGHSKLTTIKADIEQLRTLQSNMKTMSGDELVKTYEQFNLILSKVKNNLTTVSAESKTFVSSLQITTLDNKIAAWMENNSKASRDFGASIEVLRNKLSSLGASGNATASQLNEVEQEFNQIKQSAIAAGQTGATLGSTLKGAFSSILRYVSVSTVIYQAIAAMKEMYQNVYNIDKEMTELKKVTNETSSSYKKFLSGAGTTAKQIGTTISNLVSSTADFARLGYSFGDSQELAKTANIYSVVGDEIADIDTATKSIISTMAAFKISADDSISIVDRFNEVGNNFAISSGGIGDALERSASSLAAANNTLDQSIALITAGNTVVQDADAVGTAFKTMTMRIRGAKTELEDAGLDTDGMAESTAKLRDEIKALSGVDIMLDEDTFKSTYDIMDELADKWEELTDIQQASITELIAGKRLPERIAMCA